MNEVSKTNIILYRYLQALSVKVSRSTVLHLLNTPVGNSMRGISDALDILHIKNEVYQLPPSYEYFTQLNTPFITMLQVSKDPFCTVTKKDDFIVEFSNTQGKKHCIEVDTFLKKWTGTILIGETTENTPSDTFHIWKNFCYFLSKYKIVIAILLILILGFITTSSKEYSQTLITYLGTLGFGILVSIAILYKELFDKSFLERFCHIGQVVDCNKVLHAKGANIAGAGLGELSLLYFSVMFLFCTIQPTDFYGISVICCAAATCFTVYSVIYQVFILHKGCMLCMLINLTIWAGAAMLYLLSSQFAIGYSILSLGIFIATGAVCLALGITFNSYAKEHKEKHLLKERFSTLLKPATFYGLLEFEPSINAEIPFVNIAINNSLPGDNRLLVITNPNCKNCADAHAYLKELSSKVPLSLLLLTHPNDHTGKQVSDIIVAAYCREGWDKAMLLLEKWFKKQAIAEVGEYKITPEVEEMREAQIVYCRKQGINRTPSFIINGHHLPEVYPLSSLRYVLT